jgi:hypothetical protein
MKYEVCLNDKEVELLRSVLRHVLNTEFRDFAAEFKKMGHEEFVPEDVYSTLMSREDLLFMIDADLKAHPYYKALTLMSELEAVAYDTR